MATVAYGFQGRFGGRGGARYAWHVNVRSALKEGMDRGAIDAIEQGREPAGLSGREAAALQVCADLLQTRTLSEPTYRRALREFGEAGLADVVATSGFYSMVSMTLNAFDVDPPSD